MASVSLRLALAAIFAALAAAAVAAATELGYSRSMTPGLIAHRERQFGRGVRERLVGWQAFVRETGAPGESTRQPGEDRLLRAVNRFFNRVPSMTDLAHWGADDYWATPSESLASNGADCEDYAIAKYMSLLSAGVPQAKLRMVYVRAQFQGRPQAHMVLAYYAQPEAEPLILDNINPEIRPASLRPDLTPVFSFNGEGLWSGVGGTTAGNPLVRLSLWRDLLAKAKSEGF